jgi:phosphatidate phosphatase APP1
MLLSHWGPTPEGWFRSGVRHKREQLFRLFDEFPHVRWLLVGDDTQHDPALYIEAATSAPDKVLDIAIRQLSAVPNAPGQGTVDPHVYAPDGFGLREGLAGRGLILPRESAADGEE